MTLDGVVGVTVAADGAVLVDGSSYDALLDPDGTVRWAAASVVADAAVPGPYVAACPAPCDRPLLLTPDGVGLSLTGVEHDGVHVAVSAPVVGVTGVYGWSPDDGLVWARDVPAVFHAGPGAGRFTYFGSDGVVRVLGAEDGAVVADYAVDGWPAGALSATMFADGFPPLIVADDEWFLLDVGESAGRLVDHGSFDVFATPYRDDGLGHRSGMLLPRFDGTYDLDAHALVPGTADRANLAVAARDGAVVDALGEGLGGPYEHVAPDGTVTPLTLEGEPVLSLVPYPGSRDWLVAVSARAVALVAVTRDGVEQAWSEPLPEGLPAGLLDLALGARSVAVAFGGGLSTQGPTEARIVVLPLASAAGDGS